MIDNSACPLCKDCVQHVWSACKSVRTASFASDAYQDAFADAGLGLTISRSQVIAIRPPKFPHDKLLVEPLPLEAGARNGPRYLLVDVLRAIYQYSAGQPGRFDPQFRIQVADLSLCRIGRRRPRPPTSERPLAPGGS